MPVFDYRALDQCGKTTSGIIDAESINAARNKLRSGGLFPTIIKESQETSSSRKWRFLHRGLFTATAKPSDIWMSARQLATLLKAGFPLVNALDALISQSRPGPLKKILAEVKDYVLEGGSLAAAVDRYPSVFSPLFVNMVRAGESSGTLETVLYRIAEIGEKQEALMQRIRSASVYPAIMLMIGTAVLYFLMTHIVPSITSIFNEMDQVLPAPTRLLMSLSLLARHYGWLLPIAVFLIVVLFKRFRRTKTGKHFLDRLMIRTPFVGNVLRKTALSRFSRTLGTLIGAGVPMISALSVARGVVLNSEISGFIASGAESVSKGVPLSKALSNEALVPPIMIQMIQVGEQSGELENMLETVADMFSSQVENLLMNLTTLMEPLIIVALGIIIGFVVLAICLPIFEMNQLVG